MNAADSIGRRDLLGVLADHPRRTDAVARLVEGDDRNVEYARAAASSLGLTNVEVIAADASSTSVYESHCAPRMRQ